MADKGPYYYSSINVGGRDGHYYSSLAVGGEKTRASYPADKSQAYHNAAYSPTSSLGKDKYRPSSYEAQPQAFYQSSSPGKEAKHRSPSHGPQPQALYPVVTPGRDDKYPPTSYDAQAQAYYSAPYKGSSPKRRADKYRVDDRDANDDFTLRMSRKRCYIILCVIVFLAALALGLGLGLYFGVFRKSESKADAETTSMSQQATGTTEAGQTTTTAGQTTTESGQTTTIAGQTTTESIETTTESGQTTTGPGPITTTSGPAEITTTKSTTDTPTTATPDTTAVSYEVGLTLDQPYTSDLDNPTSLVYTDLKINVENLMNSIMGSSDLSDSYNGSTVVGFSEGSVIAKVLTVFWKSKTQLVQIDVAVVLTEVKKGFVREAAAVRSLNILEDQTRVELVTRSGTKGLNEACEDVSDCSERHTDCSGWPTPVCRCLPQYYSNYGTTTGGGKCDPKVGMNKYGCTDKSQCTDSEALCSNTKCICPDTHRYDGSRCVKIKSLGEKCEHSIECSIMFQCTNNTCACPDDQYPDGAVCRTEPAACDDQNNLLSAAVDCSISPLTLAQDIQGYTCRELTEKLNCVVDSVNADRPLDYDCNGTDIKVALLGPLQSQGITTAFSIEDCSEFTVKVVYYEETCADKVVPEDVENDFKIYKLPVLFDGLDYRYIGARCNSYDYEVAVWTDKLKYALETLLNTIIYSHELFVGDSLYTMVEQASLGTDYCKNLATLKQLGIGCVRDYVDSYWWSDWETCSPVVELGRCINREISSQINNKWCHEDDIMDLLFNDDTVREQFIEDATSKLTTPGFELSNGEQQMLEAVSRFSKEKCSVDRSEGFPCDDYQQRVDFYNSCKAKSIITSIFNIDNRLPNYGLTADNCRDFFHLVSCIADEFSKLRVWCSGLEQFVYDKLKTELGASSVLPTTYYEIDFCAEHQPVCTSTFIHDARDRCALYGGYNYDSPDCSAEEDVIKAVSYVTCVRLIALSKYQEDCTTTRIKEIINNDYYKLGVIYKFADIDKCIPDDSIASILPTIESVCTSGIPIALYQGRCAMFSYNPTTSSRNYTSSPTKVGPCTTRARDIVRAGLVDLGCRLYLTEMSCVQTILANMSFDCSMDQLANSPVPSSSPLYIPTFKPACLDIYNNEEYQTCDAGLVKSSYAPSCSMGLVDLPDAYTDNPQKFCTIHQESLGCYDLAARSEGLTCAFAWLNRFLTSVAVLQRYARRPAGECSSVPDTSAYDACPAVIPQGRLCTDHGRVTNLVAGICSVVGSQGFTQLNTTQQIDENVITCRRLSDMLWCGTNVTRLGGENCTLQQVSDAVFARQDIIAATMPNFQINVCQDSCYELEAAENTCVLQQLYAWGIDDCRLLSYMWSCLDANLRSNDGNHCAHSIIRSVIAMATARYHMKQDILDKCPDPSLNPLDICTNPADIASLGGYSCTTYMYNMSSRNCMDGDKARTCYRNVIDTLGGSCTDKLVEEAILLGGFLNGYDVTRCVGQNYLRTGFCPFSYSNYCGGRNMGTDACMFDTDCDSDLKCCYHDCNTTCREPLTEPARWYGELFIKNETFESDMGIKESSAYQNFLQRYSDLISEVLGQFYRYEIDKLSRGVVISFHVWSSQDPRNRIESALNTHFPDYHLIMEIGTVRRDEIDRPGECPYSDNMGTDCGEICEYDADCPGSTAKCCYNPNCGQFGDSRCFDQGISEEKGYDCKDILDRGFGSVDGVYDIQLKNNGETIQVYCDMTTDGGGWTVFQRRFDGSVDFFRNSVKYEDGFGSKDGEFWLGLKYVYNMTHGVQTDMRLDLENAIGDTIYELDNGFRLGEAPYYKLYIDGYWISGGVWDPVGVNTGLGYYNGHPFSTYDADYSGFNCTAKSHGAFWYSACSDVNPNGEYVTPGTERQGGLGSGYGGMIYHQWMGFKSLKSTKMMIRRP